MQASFICWLYSIRYTWPGARRVIPLFWEKNEARPFHARKIHPRLSECWKVAAHLLARAEHDQQSRQGTRDLSFGKNWRCRPASPSCFCLSRSSPNERECKGENDLMLFFTCSYSRKTWRFLSFLRLGWLASLCRKTWKKSILEMYYLKVRSDTSCWATVFLNVARYSASNSWIVLCEL